MDQNPPSNVEDTGLARGLTTAILHAKGKLSPLATTTEPALQSLCAATKERLSTATKTQHSQKKPLQWQKQNKRSLLKKCKIKDMVLEKQANVDILD